MNPIYINSKDEQHSFESFLESFLSDCERLKKQDQAMIFAFILYDFENAQIAKVLADQHYWQSLNSISGKYLTVFSLHHKQNTKNNLKQRHKLKRTTASFLTTIPTFANPSESSNLLIERYLGSDVQINYPAVLFFQTDSDRIIDHSLVELDEQEMEKAFLELKGYIKVAVETLKLITPENKGNEKEIFRNVERLVKEMRKVKIVKRKIKEFTSVADLGLAIAGVNFK